ncbi:hypothetical protein [Pseudoclavibacter helvolus]|uniref:hypothetical protein n=1 Tax=Pseudoclavibacter helvolus TaxID=255205 RepID=UPI003735FDEC
MTARHVLPRVEVVAERGLEDATKLGKSSGLPRRRRAAEREEDPGAMLHELTDP